MQEKTNAKRARAVVVTVALIVAANFAISRAESVSFSDGFKIDKYIETVAKPSTSGFLAADGTIYQPAPRPSISLAADGTIYQPAPRPSGSFAADGTIYQPAPRPSGSFAADGTIYQPAPRPS